METLSHFEFSKDVSMQDVRDTLHLAKIAAICLHGDDVFQQQTMVLFAPTRRFVQIDTTYPAGRDYALLFGGYVRREFGDDAVKFTRSGAK